MYPLWDGYVPDEGRWTEIAREVALGRPAELDYLSRLHVMLSPVYQAVTTAVFLVFGPSMTVARAISAGFGVALTTGAYLFLGRYLTPSAAVAGALLLAFQPDLVFLSRTAIPEIPALFFETVAFFILVSGPGYRRALLAGLTLALALGMKGTAAPVVVAMAGVALLSHGDRVRGPVLRLAAMSVGVVVPGLLAGALALLALGGGGEGGLFDAASQVAEFVQPATPYGVLAQLWYSPAAPWVFALLLPIWVIAGLVVAKGTTLPGRLRPIYLGSAAWIAVWLGCAALLEYFPERYAAHVFAPLAINLAAGISILHGWSTDTSLADRVRRGSPTQQAFVRAWFSIAPAVLVGSILLAALSAFVPGADRLTTQILCVGVLFVLLVLVAPRNPAGTPAVVGVFAPPIFVAAWYAQSAWPAAATAFWDTSLSAAATRAALMMGAGALVVALKRHVERVGPTPGLWLAWLPLVAVPWLGQIVPPMVAPTFTLKEAAQRLEEVAEGADLVGAQLSEGLFLYTDLEFTRVTMGPNPPDVIVAAFYPLDYLGPEYRIERHDFRVSDAYLARGAPGEHAIWIYERTGSNGGADPVTDASRPVGAATPPG